MSLKCIPNIPFRRGVEYKPIWTLPDKQFKRLYVWGTMEALNGIYMWIWVYSKYNKFFLGGDPASDRYQVHFQYYVDDEMQVV